MSIEKNQKGANGKRKLKRNWLKSVIRLVNSKLRSYKLCEIKQTSNERSIAGT